MTTLRPITDAERRLMTHVSMFGSDGYPVTKLGRKWVWGTADVKGPPTVFATKREAVASFERFLDVLREALGVEASARAIDACLDREGMITFGDYQARRLDVRKSPSGPQTEVYAVEAAGDAGRPICQAELFKGPTHTEWSAWIGPNWRHRRILELLCEARNGVLGAS